MKVKPIPCYNNFCCMFFLAYQDVPYGVQPFKLNCGYSHKNIQKYGEPLTDKNDPIKISCVFCTDQR